MKTAARISRWPHRSLFFIPITFALACQWALRDGSARTDQRSPVVFSHERHLASSIECLECHENIDASSGEKVSHLPRKETCLGCHKPQYVERNAPALDELQPRWAGLHFSHQRHMAATQKSCLTCHGDVPRSAAFRQHSMPSMDSCMSCHQAAMVKKECTLCHESQRLSATRPTRYLSHEGDWVQKHRDPARGDSASCSQCHTQDHCADCHNRYETLLPSVKRPDQAARNLIHRGDFVSRHFIEARGNASQCLTCHSVSRCDGCHVQKGVSFASAESRAQALPRSLHPQDFMDRTSVEFHGRAARRDIVACASCHDQGPATNCIGCHRTGRFGGNPHPVGFSSRLDRKTTPMCQWCHEGR